MPQGWKWKYSPALRSNNKGRAKGGIITGVKESFKEIGDGCTTHNILERRIEIGSSKWKVFTIYNPEGGEEFWKELNEKLDDLEKDKIIIGGDFNGKEGSIIYTQENENERQSKDKVINKQGSIMIKECTERGWHILNGNMINDEKGEFTYIGETGESVIDYGVVNEWALSEVVSFSIKDKSYSDHLPIVVEIKNGNHKLESKMKKEEKRIKHIWDDEGIKNYREYTARLTFENHSVDEDLTELLNVVKKNSKKKIYYCNPERYLGKNRWWDTECRIKRRELNKMLRKAKNGEEEMCTYRKNRKEYKMLCLRKKEEEKTKLKTEISEVSNEGEVWKFINKYKPRSEINNNKIPVHEWKKYFQELLKGVEYKKEEPQKRETMGVVETENLSEDIEKQIRTLKKGKACGFDGVENEAWLYSEGAVREKIKEIIIRVWKGEGFPSSWRTGVICPIWKKGSKEEPKNYRGITLLSTSYKLYAMTLNEKLTAEIEPFLPDSQAGFRKK